ncbi:MAG: hypothetical protein ABID54_09940 [Pseudomonadota bacterium]
MYLYLLEYIGDYQENFNLNSATNGNKALNILEMQAKIIHNANFGTSTTATFAELAPICVSSLLPAFLSPTLKVSKSPLACAFCKDRSLVRRVWEVLNNIFPTMVLEEWPVHGGLYKLEPKELGIMPDLKKSNETDTAKLL